MVPDDRGDGRRQKAGPLPRVAGFTMIEVLVVVAIISILAGLITVSVQHARSFSEAKRTRMEIQALIGAAEGFKQAFGTYPPSTFAVPPLKFKTNGINEGNECLLAYLTTQKKGGPFLMDLGDDRLENLDQDSLSAKNVKVVVDKLDWTRGNSQLLEYVDLWGNPFVYIHNRDYRSRKKIKYVDGEGKTVEVKASKSKKTGAYQNPTSCQIWSFGQNRINENGEGDDVVSWRE